MVNLITGPKGTGKTQQMIELANEKVKTSNGNVVFIKKSHRNTTTLDFGVRAICMEDYPDILTMDEFIGFLIILSFLSAGLFFQKDTLFCQLQHFFQWFSGVRSQCFTQMHFILSCF